MEQQNSNGNDHDLLIRVDTKLGTLINEMQLLRDDNNRRIGKLEDGKVSLEDFKTYKTEHERDGEKILKNIDEAIGGISEQQTKMGNKVDKLVIGMATLAGGIAVLQFVMPLILHHFNLL